LVNDSGKDEERTYSYEIRGRGGEKLEETATQGNIEKNLNPTWIK